MVGAARMFLQAAIFLPGESESSSVGCGVAASCYSLGMAGGSFPRYAPEASHPQSAPPFRCCCHSDVSLSLRVAVPWQSREQVCLFLEM